MDISVLIITRGESPHIRATLGSILTQNKIPDQVVIVTEKDIEIHRTLLVETLGEVIGNLEVVLGPGEGAAKAWNKGILTCNSEFIAIIDDDDMWLPAHLSRCLVAARLSRSDLVLTGFYSVGSSEFKEDMLPPSSLNSEDFMMYNPGMRGSNIFIRKQVIQNAGGFDETLSTSSDRGLGIRLSLMDNLKYTPLKIRTVIHRSHDGVRMVNSSPERLESFNRMLQRHSTDLKEEQIAYTLGRIQEFWGFPTNLLTGAVLDSSWTDGWREFLQGESRPEIYPQAMNHVLSRGQMKMTDFLTHEYHRRMNSYDLAYPNSLSFEQPPKFKELVAPTLELAAHPIAREWTRRQEPGWIVDYGCGKGDVLTNLISEGYRIVLFDPDELFVTAHFESMSSWSDIGQESVISISPSSGVLSFVQNSHEITEVVAVVCSMVVCQLDSEIELKNLLSELYELLPIGGRALINWCCPSLKDVRQFHAHEIIQTINSDPPMYEKKCLKSGVIREEVVWGTEDLLAASPPGLELRDDWFVWGWNQQSGSATPWIQFCEFQKVK